MRKLLTAVAAATILLAGSAMWKAEAATPSSPVLPPLTQSAPPVENVGCWCGPYRCACRRPWWGPGVYRYHAPRRYYRWRY
jgi:hypothetical protein